MKYLSALVLITLPCFMQGMNKDSKHTPIKHETNRSQGPIVVYTSKKYHKIAFIGITLTNDSTTQAVRAIAHNVGGIVLCELHNADKTPTAPYFSVCKLRLARAHETASEENQQNYNRLVHQAIALATKASQANSKIEYTKSKWTLDAQGLRHAWGIFKPTRTSPQTDVQ